MLAIEQDYTDEFMLPPIIKEQIGQTNILQLYFCTRGALIDAIVSQIFDDDEAATPPLSPTTLNPNTPDSDVAGTRYR